MNLSIIGHLLFALAALCHWNGSCTLAFSSIFAPKLTANPILKTFSDESSIPPTFTIRLDIQGNDSTSAIMSVTGLALELHAVEPFYTHPKLPGANGPHPALSTGPRAIKIRNHGSFVSLAGTQLVPLVQACWEVVWKEGAPAGSLVCGFHLDTAMTRNDCTFPKGNIYLSFPIWDKVDLVCAQLKKKELELRANQYLADKDTAMRQYQESPNPFKKALHYRNAAMAMSKYFDSGVVEYTKAVPDMEDVVEWKEGNSKLLVTTKGLVWTKDGSFLRGDHALIGTAYLKPSPRS